MPRFFITFPHRLVERRHKYQEIQAPDEREARRVAFAAFGTQWAFSYDEKEFAGQIEEFGLSPLGEPLVVAPAEGDGRIVL